MRNRPCYISTMKEKPSIRVIILFAYFALSIGGTEGKCIKGGSNTSRVLMNCQVNKTIMVEGGDVYDCVGVNLQPAFHHPLLKDHKIQMEPSSLPFNVHTESPSSMHTIPQAQLSIIDCPTGTVPILRNNRGDHVATYSIDQVVVKGEQQEAAGIKYFDELYGTRARINVYEPKVKTGSKDLSASSIQIGGRSEVTNADSIGVGSWVYPSYSGDNFARFHVYWYDGLQNKDCVDHECPAFVQVSSIVGLGGRIHPVSIYNGPQYEIVVQIFKDPKTKNWWVTYGEKNTPIGYWPSSLFHYMKQSCNYALWGGYVTGPTASTNSPQMGSGHFGSEGYGKAAFMKNIQIVDKNNNHVTPHTNKARPGSSNLDKYTTDGYDVNKYGMHIYYGGPGAVV
ncbi:hypothetical protein ZWY2020_023169 [Hordeum vulgare]|nr:hypothetical protein ZWY2020_023169 [Hordeum vulgare]